MPHTFPRGRAGSATSVLPVALAALTATLALVTAPLALADPAVADRLRGLGFAITVLPPQEFAARAAASSAQAAPVIRAIAERSPRG